MRLLLSVVLWLAIGVYAQAQTRFVKYYNSVSDLRAANPNDVSTTAVVKYNTTSGTLDTGATYYYDSSSSAADDGVSVIKPNGFNGRWLRLSGVPSSLSLLLDPAMLRTNGSGQITAVTNRTLPFWINVKDYGAVGDGVTDDTTAIQNALNVAQSFSPPRPLYAPASVYIIGPPFLQVTNSHVGIVGDGIQSTIFKCTTNSGGNMIYVHNANSRLFSVAVVGVQLEASSSLTNKPSGLVFQNASECAFDQIALGPGLTNSLVVDSCEIIRGRRTFFDHSAVGAYLTHSDTNGFGYANLWLDESSFDSCTNASVLIDSHSGKCAVYNSWIESTWYGGLLKNKPGTDAEIDSLIFDNVRFQNLSDHSFDGGKFLSVTASSGTNYLTTVGLHILSCKINTPGSSNAVEFLRGTNVGGDFQVSIDANTFLDATNSAVYADTANTSGRFNPNNYVPGTMSGTSGNGKWYTELSPPSGTAVANTNFAVPGALFLGSSTNSSAGVGALNLTNDSFIVWKNSANNANSISLHGNATDDLAVNVGSSTRWTFLANGGFRGSQDSTIDLSPAGTITLNPGTLAINSPTYWTNANLFLDNNKALFSKNISGSYENFAYVDNADNLNLNSPTEGGNIWLNNRIGTSEIDLKFNSTTRDSFATNLTRFYPPVQMDSGLIVTGGITNNGATGQKGFFDYFATNQTAFVRSQIPDQVTSYTNTLPGTNGVGYLHSPGDATGVTPNTWDNDLNANSYTATNNFLSTLGGIGLGITPVEKVHVGGTQGKIVLDGGNYSNTKSNSQGVAVSSDTTHALFFNGVSAERPEISWFRGTRNYPEGSIRQHTTVDSGLEIWAGPGTAAPTLTMGITKATGTYYGNFQITNAATVQSITSSNGGTLTNIVLVSPAVTYNLTSIPSAQSGSPATNWVVAFGGGTNTYEYMELTQTNNIFFQFSTNRAPVRTLAILLNAGANIRTNTLNASWKRLGSLTSPFNVTNGTKAILSLTCFGGGDSGVDETNVVAAVAYTLN